MNLFYFFPIPIKLIFAPRIYLDFVNHKMPTRRLTAEVSNYRSQLKTHLATTRFNNKTWKENQEYLNNAIKHGQLQENIKCIYPCSSVISGEAIPYKSNVFVIEMNNETNKILGIGLIKNVTPEYNKHNVYEKNEYNHFTYQGGYHIGNQEFTEDEKSTIILLETLCFKGRRHQKRLNGIKAFPNDILYDHINHPDQTKRRDIIKEITQMFKQRFQPK